MSSDGEHYYLVEVIAFILKYLKDEFSKHLATAAYRKCSSEIGHGESSHLQTSDFDWVITVPAIWKHSSKQMMRQAAYMVNMNATSNLYLCTKIVGWSLF